MPNALIALGANLGERQQTIRRAVERLTHAPGISQARVSTLHETRPIGGPAAQNAFLNAAVACETSLSASELLRLLQQVETDLGRVRHEHWGPRVIDLDLLLYGDELICTAELQVPHPRMAFRRFVLEPANEVAPGMVHPLIGWTVGELLEHLNQAPPYVAVLGAPDAEPEAVAQQVAASVGADFLRKPPGETRLAPAGDPSGPHQESPIQFLDLATSLLAGRDWTAGRPAISGFYLDQLLAEACGELDGENRARCEEAWRRQTNVIRPKLLVVLDCWDAVVVARGKSPAGNAPCESREAVLHLAARGGQPLVCAGRTNREAQLAEIAAALEAMPLVCQTP